MLGYNACRAFLLLQSEVEGVIPAEWSLVWQMQIALW